MSQSIKSKIYFAVFVWLLLAFVMFAFVFKRLEASNLAALGRLDELKREQGILEAEKASFLAGKNDLQKLALEKIQPEDFFSRDITLVNEIRRLESIAADLSLKMTLGGVAGTLKSAKRASTKSEIYQIPFIITLQGSLTSVVSFMEYLENLEFLTSISAASISAAGSEGINATLSASFYLKK